MKKNFSSSNRKYIALILGVVGAALLLSVLFRDKLDVTLIGKVTTNPTDKEENLEYGKTYHPSSERIIQRDGVVVKNFGTELKAEDLESGVSVDAGNMKDKSKKEILKFSEYVGYFYMYDGETVYRITVNDPEKVHTAIKSCVKYEPMGNYLYSLREKNGKQRLFRCSVTGTNEKMLFKEEIEDFWAYGGNLLLQLSDGQYRWYNVISENSLEHTLPKFVQNISLDQDNIYYLSDENENDMRLYRRPCNSQEDTAFTFSSVSTYSAADGKIGLLLSSPDGSLKAAWCQADGTEECQFEGKVFPEDSQVDVSKDHLYVTEPDGTTWATELEKENWIKLFDEEKNE